MKRWIAVLGIGLLLMGCSTMKIEDFAANKPVFDLETYFSGRTEASGVVQDLFGRVRRQFTATMDGRKEGDEFVLSEEFLYDDGEVDRRVWRIRSLGDGRYEGRASDVLDVAAGRAAGNALHWRYQMLVPIGSDRWRIAFDDWMFLQPNGMAINRASMRKFGIEIGTLTVAFTKPAQKQASLDPQSLDPQSMDRRELARVEDNVRAAE